MKHTVEAASESGLKWTEGDSVTDLDFEDEMHENRPVHQKLCGN